MRLALGTESSVSLPANGLQDLAGAKYLRLRRDDLPELRDVFQGASVPNRRAKSRAAGVLYHASYAANAAATNSGSLSSANGLCSTRYTTGSSASGSGDDA